MAAPTHRLRTALRIIGGIFAGLVGLIIVAVITLVLVARSDWGHRKILTAVTPLLGKIVQGQVSIGELDGDLIHMLVLRNVELRDVEGGVVARVQSLGVRYNLLALTAKTLHITAVDLKGEVNIRYLSDGRLNVGTLLAPSPPHNNPLPLKILVHGVAAELVAHYDQPPVPFARPVPPVDAMIHLAAGVDISPEIVINADVKALNVQVQAPAGVQLDVKGKIDVKGQEIAFHPVEVGVSTTGAEINKLVPAAKLLGSYNVQAKAEGTLDELQAVVDVKLPAGTIHVKAKATPKEEKLPWELALAIHDFDGRALRADIPQTKLQLEATARGEGASGRLELRLLEVAVEDNAVELSGWAEMPPGLLDSKDWLAARTDLTLNIKAFHLAQMARVGYPALGGQLSGITHVILDKRSVHLTTATAGKNLSGFGVGIERLNLDVDAVDLSGQIKLLVNNLRVAKQHFSQIELAARGKKEFINLRLSGQGPEQVAFRLGLDARPEYPAGAPKGSLEIRGLDADLKELLLTRVDKKLELVQPAHIRVTLPGDPTIDVEHFGLAFAEQRFILDGHYETEAQRLRGKLAAKNIDVRKLAKLFSPDSDLPDTKIDLNAQVGGTVQALTGHVAVNANIGTSKSIPLPRSVAQITADLANKKITGALSLRPVEADKGPQVSAHFAGPMNGQGQLHLDASVQAKLESFQDFLPESVRDRHLRGAVDVQVVADGTINRPELTLRVSLPAWQTDVVGGKATTIAVDYKQAQLSAKLAAQFFNSEWSALGGLQLDALTPLQVGAGVSGAQIVRQLETGAAAVNLYLAALDVPKIWKAVRLEESPVRGGKIDATVQFRGPLLGATSPTLALQVNAHDIDYAGDQNLPPVKAGAEVKVAYHNDQAVVDLNAMMDGKPLVQGHVETKVRVADLINNAAATVQQLPLAGDIKILPTELPKTLPLHGQISAEVKVSGTVDAPQATADVNAEKLILQQWSIGKIQVHATLDKKTGVKADVQLLPAAGQPGEFKLSALVPLPFNLESPDLKAQLRIKGYRIDYQPANQSSQELASGGSAVRLARGILDAEVDVHGGKPIPVATGFFKLSKGEFSASALPQVFRELTVDLRIDKTGLISLHKVSAEAEGGSFMASGSVKLDGLVLRKVALTAKASRFPIAAGPIGLWLDSQVNIDAETKGDSLTGKVKIARTTVTLPKLESARSVQPLGPLEDVKLVDLQAQRAAKKEAQAAEKKEQRVAAAKEAAPSTLPTHTHITVEIPTPIEVIGPEVRASLDGHLDLRIDGPRNVPIIKGEIHSIAGWIQLFKKHYELDKAQVSLSGETPPNPLLDIQISARMQDVNVRIGVSGTAAKPRIRMSSDPSIYDQSQIIVLVLAGGRQGGGSVQSTVVGGLSSLLIGQLQTQLAGALPIDVIRFDVGSNDPMSTNRTSLEIGKYIRDDLFLLYTHRFGSSLNTLHRTNNDEVTLEWHFKQNYQIDLMAGDQGMGSLNLYWLKRF